MTGKAAAGRLIGIVDDDEPVRDSISSLLRSAGFNATTFPSAEAFLKSHPACSAACLILDVRMPGMSGLDLQRRIAETGSSVPVIFATAHADDCVRRRAHKQGAIAVLRKPFSDEALFQALGNALK